MRTNLAHGLLCVATTLAMACGSGGGGNDSGPTGTDDSTTNPTATETTATTSTEEDSGPTTESTAGETGPLVGPCESCMELTVPLSAAGQRVDYRIDFAA